MTDDIPETGEDWFQRAHVKLPVDAADLREAIELLHIMMCSTSAYSGGKPTYDRARALRERLLDATGRHPLNPDDPRPIWDQS